MLNNEVESLPLRLPCVSCASAVKKILNRGAQRRKVGAKIKTIFGQFFSPVLIGRPRDSD